jgi:LuxR family maltose regulon positive regulatory protein
MPNRPAAALLLRAGDRAELERWSRSSSVPAGLAQRARLVLMAADGLPNHEIADRAGVSRPTVSLWRSRYAEQGLAGLTDRERPGRPRQANTPDPRRAPKVRRGDPLLLTKLSLPSHRRLLVPRRTLSDRIGEGADRKLTLLSAPAGFGKSTLLGAWAAAASAAGRPVAWLSLDSRDNDPARFWRYVLEALSSLQPATGGAAALFELPQAPPIVTVLTAMINDFAVPADVTLVLDDYHLIESPAVHEAMIFVLDNLPARLHLVIATRADPPLPLSRLRARGDLLELRAADLRFGDAEAQTYLNQVMGLGLSAEQVAGLVARTEGWVGGLQMAALAIRGHSDIDRFIATFAGSNRHVTDYLAEEVLERQSEPVRAFLLQTSILDRMCASLCVAITARRDSQNILEALEHANLFVDPLDDDRRWYRYHRLFADVLQQRLHHEQPDMVAVLQRKAGAWFEAQGLVQEAIQYALRSRETDRAARLIESIGVTVVLDQQVQTVLGWLDDLPAALVLQRPALGTVRALALVFSDRPDAAEASLQDAERHLPDGPSATEDVRAVRGRVAVIRAAIARYSGDVERSVAHGRRALEVLPENDATAIERASATAHASLTYQVTGDVHGANERSLEAALAAFSAMGALVPVLNGITRLARLQMMQGRLHTAYDTYQRAADAVSQRDGLSGAVNNAAYYVGLGRICFEWNDLESADWLLRRAVDLVTGGIAVDADVVTDGYLALARLQQARGRQAEARATLDGFIDVARRRAFFPLLVERGEAARARLSLTQDRLPDAVGWALTCGLGDAPPAYTREQQQLTWARVRIAQGTTGDLEQAVALLARLCAAAEEAVRTDSVIEILVLRALALQAAQEIAAADAIGRALVLAEPGGYVRMFIGEGAPMTTLLRTWVASRRREPHRPRPDAALRHALQLLAELDRPQVGTTGADHDATPAYALTARERDVLELIAAGMSNREIAGRLFIATSTVKYYTTGLFRRLGVQSRTQAIAAARTLHLIDS